MKKKQIFIVIILILSFCINSCNSWVSVEEEIERLKSCPIDLCISHMKCVQIGNGRWSKDDSVSISQLSPGLVVYFDSTICAPCAVQSLYKWQNIMDVSTKNKNQFFKFYFIFSTQSYQMENMKYFLNSISFDYPIFLDTCNIFIRKNAHMPTNQLLHVFMIDKHQNVVFVGSPLNNEKLKNAYFRQLRQIIENN